jgi:hypothetical protein
MKRRTAQKLCEVKADHEGWETEVEQMEATLAYLFKDIRHWITRYDLIGSDGRKLAVGFETASSEVLKRARKLGWLDEPTGPGGR